MLANIIVFDVGSTYTKAAAFHMERRGTDLSGQRTVSDNIKPDSGRRGCGAGSDPESGSDY